jgi:hypothetical protein
VSLVDLSDYDFEQLVADLLSAEWKANVQAFPRGRDGGVDLRILGPTTDPLNLADGQELVIQCKHHPNGNLSSIRSDLRVEAKKPIVDIAARYVLATSARLTRKNKSDVVDLFGGRIAERDIFAREDIMALLRRHPAVEKANLKLWLTSSAVHQALVHQTEYLRSAALVSDLERLRLTFVETAVLRDARETLERSGVCILVGPPGVGKTTAASILLLQHMATGWRPIRAVGKVRELEDQMQPDVKQILFFDDFLGQNNIDAKLGRGEDAELVRLIRVVEHDPQKAFVLTTRDYVLQQQKQRYEKLGDEIFDVARVVVSVAGITSDQRAHILYNLLYYSPLRPYARRAPNGPRRFMELSHHPNFNPRLLDAAISATVRQFGLAHRRDAATNRTPPTDARLRTLTHVVDLDVPDILLQALDNPAKLWDHILRYQLTSLQRGLLITRLTLGPRPVNHTAFLEAADQFASIAGQRRSRADTDDALRVLDGDLIKFGDVDRGNPPDVVHALDPGVADAIITYVRQYPELLAQAADAAVVFEQVVWIANAAGMVAGNRTHTTTMSGNRDLIGRLAQAADRTLMLPGVTSKPSRQSHPFLRLGNFGERLEVLASLFSLVEKRASACLADRVFPTLVRAIGTIPTGVLPRIVEALRLAPFEPWRSRRGEVDVAVLRRLDTPDSISAWDLLRDVLDIVPTMPEYRKDLHSRFEDFTDHYLDDAELLDPSESDIDRIIDELEELENLARRWGVTDSRFDDVAELMEQHRETQPSRHDALGPQTIATATPGLQGIDDQLPTGGATPSPQETSTKQRDARGGGSIFERF